MADQNVDAIPRVRVHSALALIEEREGQILALVAMLEARLGDACNNGADPADDAPINEWRASQVLLALAERDHARAVRRELGMEPATA